MSRPLLLLALLLGAVVGCSDQAGLPTDPIAPELSKAVHGDIPAPAVNTSVSLDDVLLEFSWSDDASWQFVTFSIFRDGVRVIDGGKVRPYTAGTVYNASWSDLNVLPDTYVYCVKVMAKAKPGKGVPATTHHSIGCMSTMVQ